ncbi:MAG: class I SAM-dependent methyltransferase [Bacteroidota bacterium]
MASVIYALTSEISEYIESISLREPAVLRRLRSATEQMERGGMQISPEQGQFMRLLIQLMGAKHVLELGVFTGYSTLSMALALPDDGQIIACDVNDEWTSIARRYWEEAGVAQKIDLRLAPATQTLEQLLKANCPLPLSRNRPKVEFLV